VGPRVGMGVVDYRKISYPAGNQTSAVELVASHHNVCSISAHEAVSLFVLVCCSERFMNTFLAT
jgi:hypothetical protein